MDRKAVARQTLEIMSTGWYETEGKRVEIRSLQEDSINRSILLTPEQGLELLKHYENGSGRPEGYRTFIWNCSTVDAILRMAEEGQGRCAVLNFASARNPGGGFINGAMAQEESLAASSCLYGTLTAHEEYYRFNRACGSMIYTDHAIYSPDVVFFRNGSFQLLKEPVTASVLTLPAVNMGQVILKGEDVSVAERAMKHRMKLALAIFAEQGCKNLILGAYGCGVFRNDPVKIAGWWRELLSTCYADQFDIIIYAVLDRSSSRLCLKAFLETGEK